MKSKTTDLDKIAKSYHQSNEVPDKFIEDLQQHYSWKVISENLDFNNKDVLELGYGEGIISDYLMKENCSLQLIEGAQSLVEMAKSKGIEVTHSLFEEFEPTKKFDIILANHVLEHVDDPRVLLKKMSNWLKPSGKIFSIVPNSESLHRRIGLEMKLQKSLDELSPRDHQVGHQRVYNIRELRSDFESSQFKVLNEGGYFLKLFANSAMLDLPEECIQGFLDLSQDFPTEMQANIFILAGL